eukprot:SAG31_NODE_27264_length_429_cov_0.621212_1_plen_39_part_10
MAAAARLRLRYLSFWQACIEQQQPLGCTALGADPPVVTG